MNKAVLFLSVLVVLLGQISWGASFHRGRKPKVVVVKFDEKGLRDQRRAELKGGGTEAVAAQSRLYARRAASAQDDQLESLSY